MTEIIIALVIGFGYYYYIYNIANFVNYNPDVVFFLSMLTMFVVSLFIKKTFFVCLFSVSAILFWVLDKTPLLEEIEKWQWLLAY